MVGVLTVGMVACSSSSKARDTGPATTPTTETGQVPSAEQAATTTAPGTPLVTTVIASGAPVVLTAGGDGSLSGSVGALTITGTAGALPAGQAVTVSQAASHASFPAGFVPASDIFDVTVPAGLLQSPLELAFAVPAGVGQPVILHEQTSTGWSIDPSVLAGSTLRVNTTSFSNRVLGFLSGAWGWVFDETAGTTTPCTSTPPPPTWASFSGPPASGVAHACLISNAAPSGEERVEVQLKSNRAAFLKVSWTGDATVDYEWIEGADGAMTKLVRHLMGLGQQQVVLAPGKTMTLGMRRPVGTSQQLVFTFEQDNATTVLGVARELSGKVDSLLPVMGVIAACSAGTSSAGALIESVAGNLTPQDLLECSFETIKESLPLYADHLVDLGRQSIAAGDFTAEEIGSLSRQVTALRTARSFIEGFSGLTQKASWAAKAITYFEDSLKSFIADGNVVTVALVASRAPAPQPEATVPAAAVGSCLDEATALQLAEQSGAFDLELLSASGVGCVTPVIALGTLLTDDPDSTYYSFWTRDPDGSWRWVAATMGVRTVCEAVWQVDPSVDAGCGPQT